MLRINSYHRPKTLDDALEVLQRDETAVPLAGGTNLLPSQAPRVQTVVDLQALGLGELSAEGFHLHIGAMVPLQDPDHLCPIGYRQAEQAITIEVHR